MEEQQKPPPEAEEPKDNVDYSGAKKPWVTWVLIIAIGILWNRNLTLQDHKDALRDKAENKSDRDRERDFERAQSWKELYYESSKIISFTDSTAARRRDFDSPLHSQQPKP